MQKNLDILCPEHGEKIISFSQNSQPKCQKCFTQNEIPLDDFIIQLENYRLKRINSLKQEQANILKYLQDIKKELLMKKQLYFDSFNQLINLLDKEQENLIKDNNIQFQKLSKSIQSLQISELQVFQKEMKQPPYSTETEKDKLYNIKSNLILQFEKLLVQLQILLLPKIFQKQNYEDAYVCVPRNQYSEDPNVEQLPKGTYNKWKVYPIKTLSQHQKYEQIQWYHSFCGSPVYINIFGDVFCKNFKHEEKCDGIFIQKVRFSLDSINLNSQFSNPLETVGALVSGIDWCENKDGFQDLKCFCSEILRRWRRFD